MRTQSLSLPDLTTFLSVRGLSVPRRQIQYGWHFCQSGICLRHEDKYNVAHISVSLGSVCAIVTSTTWLIFCRSGICLSHQDKHNLAVISHILVSACAIKYNVVNISHSLVSHCTVKYNLANIYHSLGCVFTTKYNAANMSVSMGCVCAITYNVAEIFYCLGSLCTFKKVIYSWYFPQSGVCLCPQIRSGRYFSQSAFCLIKCKVTDISVTLGSASDITGNVWGLSKVWSLSIQSAATQLFLLTLATQSVFKKNNNLIYSCNMGNVRSLGLDCVVTYPTWF